MLNQIERRRSYVVNGLSTNSGTADGGARAVGFDVSDLAGFGVGITYAGSNLAGLGFLLEGALSSRDQATNSWLAIASFGVTNTSGGFFSVVYSGGPVTQPYEAARLRAANPNSSYAGTWSAFVFGSNYGAR